MPAAERPPKQTLNVIAWRSILPCLTVFTATFMLFSLCWPAMSPGVRAAISVNFCLPQTDAELSQSKIVQLKSIIASQVSSQLMGEQFQTIIQQTKQTGKVVSEAIEFCDRETITENIQLGFAFRNGSGQLQVEYVCQGHDDQIRFLQLLGQRVAASIDDLMLSPSHGIVAGNHLDHKKFDRAIWLANQIRSDLNQIRDDHSDSSRFNQNRRNSPYAFASTRRVSMEQSTEQPPAIADALNSIDANSLSGLLTEIKSETNTAHSNDATLSVLKVDPVKVWAVNATPDRWAMFGLLAMAGLVSGFFALYQFPADQPLATPATNVEALSQSLGIPVVAVLTTEQEPPTQFSYVNFCSSLSDALFSISKIFLIAVAVIVVGFVLIDSSIRESFFQNPFDGVARIFRVFFGYA